MAFGRTNGNFGAFGDLKKKLKDISEIFPSFYLDFKAAFTNPLFLISHRKIHIPVFPCISGKGFDLPTSEETSKSKIERALLFI